MGAKQIITKEEEQCQNEEIKRHTQKTTAKKGQSSL